MKKYNVIVVFDKDLNKTLMCKRTKEPYKGMFNLVGGKIERENDGLNEAYRELNEETNITSEDISLKQALIYRWLSSSQYFMRCTVSSGAKYAAAAALGQEDGMFQSSIVLFRTDSEEILRTIPIGNALIYDLHFLPGNTLCVLCEDALYFYELDGQCLGSYAFEDAYLKDYTLDGNGFVTLVMNLYKAGNGYTALTVGYDGTVLGTLPISEQILDISASGKYLALLTSGALSIYDQNLTEYDVSDNTTGASSAVMREDGSAILLANGHGTLYVP